MYTSAPHKEMLQNYGWKKTANSVTKKELGENSAPFF